MYNEYISYLFRVSKLKLVAQNRSTFANSNANSHKFEIKYYLFLVAGNSRQLFSFIGMKYEITGFPPCFMIRNVQRKSPIKKNWLVYNDNRFRCQNQNFPNGTLTINTQTQRWTNAETHTSKFNNKGNRKGVHNPKEKRIW